MAVVGCRPNIFTCVTGHEGVSPKLSAYEVHVDEVVGVSSKGTHGRVMVSMFQCGINHHYIFFTT